MNPKSFTSAFVFFLTSVFTPGIQAQSGPAPCPPGQTLSFYETANNGASLDCTVGTNLEFTDFSFSSIATTGSPRLITASNIEVTPDAQGLGGGFTFGGFTGFTVDGGQTATYDISYRETIFGDPPTVDGANVGMDPVTGTVSISQQTCPRGQDCTIISVDSLNPPSPVCALPGLTPPCWENSTAIAPFSTAGVDNTIVLNPSGGAVGAGFDDLAATADVVPSVPEPSFSLLVLAGLVTIGLLRRYRYLRFRRVSDGTR